VDGACGYSALGKGHHGIKASKRRGMWHGNRVLSRTVKYT